jgi:hypothetical protein
MGMWILLYRLRIGVTALALLLSVTPGQAVTCEEVRGLSTTELAYWAARLQVSPTYLAELLEKAFCALETKRDRVIAPDHTRPFLCVPKTSSVLIW